MFFITIFPLFSYRQGSKLNIIVKRSMHFVLYPIGWKTKNDNKIWRISQVSGKLNINANIQKLQIREHPQLVQLYIFVFQSHIVVWGFFVFPPLNRTITNTDVIKKWIMESRHTSQVKYKDIILFQNHFHKLSCISKNINRVFDFS